MDPGELAANARRATALLKALANEKRLLVLCLLLAGERTVGDLEAQVGLSQSALSQHLARLRADGLVATRRQAQTIHYRMASDEAKALIETLYALYCGPSQNETRVTRKNRKRAPLGV